MDLDFNIDLLDIIKININLEDIDKDLIQILPTLYQDTNIRPPYNVFIQIKTSKII